MEILQKLRVVLVRPQFPENIGAAARAVANMGLGGLHVVQPMRPWDEPMRRLATGGGGGGFRCHGHPRILGPGP